GARREFSCPFGDFQTALNWRWGDLVDESDAPHPLGAQSGARKSHLSQKGLGHKAPDALCAGPPGRHADRRLGKTKHRVWRGHTDIAGRRKLEAAAKDKTT